MTTLSHLNIRQDDVNRVENQTDHDVTVKVMLSMFDVPQSASAELEANENIIRFTFYYMGGEEPTLMSPSDEGISLKIGRASGRLYGIDVALDELNGVDVNNADELVINVAEEGVDHYKKGHPEMRSKSFEAVHRVLRTHSADLKPIVQNVLMAS
tara:strand:+ start:518 stop:982 length:465 start_codon:yes stop_codon:yes gene_type:complete